MDWELKGTVVVACNCDYGCPCNFNALPTMGKCEGSWTWHVDRGAFGDTSLDDLNFTVAVDWPGAIHEGNGEAVILVDERADQAQRDAIATLVGGTAGGPWSVLAWTWPTVHGPKPVPYEVQLVYSVTRESGDRSSCSETINTPVTGAEAASERPLPRESCSSSATSAVDHAPSTRLLYHPEVTAAPRSVHRSLAADCYPSVLATPPAPTHT